MQKGFKDYCYLDKIRIDDGVDKCREVFLQVYKKDRGGAVDLLNDSRLTFPCLFIILPIIEVLQIEGSLSFRNKTVLNIINQIQNKRKYKKDKDYLSANKEAVHPILKWIVETGYADDGLDNDYEEIMDFTVSVLINTYNDTSILPAVSDMIFQRNKKEHYIHDLVWAFFQSRTPYALKLVAERICSPEQQDIDLACKLLNLGTSKSGYSTRQKQYHTYIQWLDENDKFLYFTGESLQFSSNPIPCYRRQPVVPEDENEKKRLIILSDHPLDISEIIKEYPPGSIEGQLLSTMSESNETFRYDDLKQLKFELRLRREIVNAARELDKSDLSFAVFRESKCNPEYWDRTANGGFRLKEGVEPSAAIKDILINGNEYATECATAMMIVYYIALLNVFSEDVFNKVFSRIYLMNWHSIDPLLKEVGMPNKVAGFLIGDRAYFKNPDVDPKTPEWQGENVIVMPGERYYGHDIGIATASTIIDVLNSNRKEDATRTAYLMDTAARPDFKALAKIYYDKLPQTVLYWKPFPAPIKKRTLRDSCVYS